MKAMASFFLTQKHMAKQTETKKKAGKIKFILSPTGRFNLGYSVGDVITIGKDVNANKCKELIDSGYAEVVK